MTTSSLLLGGLLFRLIQALPASKAPLSPIPQNEVGWQSIFWSLFTLALLALTQPSIVDYDFPHSSLLFPARASPLVCFTDTIEVLISLTHSLLEGSSLSSSASKVVLHRHRDRCGGAAKREELGKSAIRMHPRASLIVFLGSLTQAVKIFSFQGVLWEKVIAGVYLGSYVIVAGVSALADDENDEEDRSPDDDEEMEEYLIARDAERYEENRSLFDKSKIFIAFGSLAISFLVCSWAVTKVCDGGEGDFEITTVLNWSCSSILKAFLYSGLLVGVWVRLLFWLPGIAIVIVCLGFGISLSWWVTEQVLKLPSSLVYLCIVIVDWCICMAAVFIYRWGASIDIVGSFLGEIADGAGLILVCFLLVWLCLVPVAIAFGWHKTSSADIWGIDLSSFLVVNAVMHLVVSCLYFSFVYSSIGTMKPRWTEMLG